MFFCKQYKKSLDNPGVSEKIKKKVEQQQKKMEKKIKNKTGKKVHKDLSTVTLDIGQLQTIKNMSGPEKVKPDKQADKNQQKLKKDARKYFNKIHYGDKMDKTGTIFMTPAMIEKIIAEENGKESPNLSLTGMLHSYSEKGMILEFSSGGVFKTFKKDLGNIIKNLRLISTTTIGDNWSQRSEKFDQKAFQEGVLKLKKFESTNLKNLKISKFKSAAHKLKKNKFMNSEGFREVRRARKKMFSGGLGNFIYFFFQMCWETLKAIVFAALFFLGVLMIVGAACFVVYAYIMGVGTIGPLFCVIFGPVVGTYLKFSCDVIDELWKAMKPLIYGTPDKNDHEKYKY